jgi:hypothetical protein
MHLDYSDLKVRKVPKFREDFRSDQERLEPPPLNFSVKTDNTAGNLSRFSCVIICIDSEN